MRLPLRAWSSCPRVAAESARRTSHGQGRVPSGAHRSRTSKSIQRHFAERWWWPPYQFLAASGRAMFQHGTLRFRTERISLSPMTFHRHDGVEPGIQRGPSASQGKSVRWYGSCSSERREEGPSHGRDTTPEVACSPGPHVAEAGAGATLRGPRDIYTPEPRARRSTSPHRSSHRLFRRPGAGAAGPRVELGGRTAMPLDGPGAASQYQRRYRGLVAPRCLDARARGGPPQAPPTY